MWETHNRKFGYNSSRNNRGRHNNNGNRFVTNNDNRNNKSDNRPRFRVVEPETRTRGTLLYRNVEVKEEPKKVRTIETIADKGKFVKKFVDNFMSQRRAPSTLINSMEAIPQLMAIMGRYHESVYDEILEETNRLIDLGTTSLFATTLNTAVKNGIVELDANTVANIKKFISILKDTSNSKMTDDTLNLYVNMIIEYLDPIAVSLLMTDFAISQDFAEDLVINIPCIGVRASLTDIKTYSDEFIATIIANAETAIDTMDAEAQSRLFYRCYGFGNPDNVCKAIGACLSDIMYDIDGETMPKIEALYNEYATMLYTTLNNDFDIKDIQSVIKFIAKSIVDDDTSKDSILFDIETLKISSGVYSNIVKAFNNLINENNEQVIAVFGDVFIE